MEALTRALEGLYTSDRRFVSLLWEGSGFARKWKADPDPHSSESWIRIRNDADPQLCFLATLIRVQILRFLTKNKVTEKLHFFHRFLEAIVFNKSVLKIFGNAKKYGNNKHKKISLNLSSRMQQDVKLYN